MNRNRMDLAAGNVATERVAPLLEVLHFDAVFRRFVKGSLRDFFIRDGNAEPRAELPQLVFVHLFLLVGDVAALAGFSEAIALDCFHQDDRRRAFVLDRGFVSAVNLLRIVSSEPHLMELLVGEMLDHLQKTAIDTKKMLAEVCAGFDAILLILAVHHFAHALYEKAVAIFFKQRIPIAYPEDFDNVPSGAAKNGFQLLNDLAVSAHPAIEPLQIAVDDEDQIIELLAGAQSYRAERFRLVGFAVADECPNLAVGAFF